MLKTSKIKQILINESKLKYFNDIEKFNQIKENINKLNYSDLKKIDKKYDLINRYSILQESILGVVGSVIGLVYYTPLWVTYRSIKAFSSKCSKRCGALKFNTNKRQLCLAKCKLIQYQKSLALLKDTEQYCPKSKYPTACVVKVKKAINEITEEIIKVKLNISKIEQKFV